MTDLPERPDLLPPHDDRPVPTALVAVDGRLDDLDMSGIVEIKSAANAGVGFLPYLAWETSVDVWDAWPEATKRAVIQAAPIVHRYKGTRYAVATALGALGVTSEIVEWWQATPRAAPYTFRVTAYAHGRLYDGPVLDARLIKVVYAAIMAAKPASRAFALSIAAVMTDRPGLAPAITARGRVPASLRPINRDDFTTAFGLASAAAARATIPASLKPASDETLASPVGLAPVAALRARVPVAMRPQPSDGLASRPGLAPAAVARVRLSLSMRASA